MTTTLSGPQRALLLLLRNTSILLFVLVFAVFSLLSPRFLQVQSFINILNQASYIGIVAVGMTFVLLTAGIDLSVGSVMYLSTVVAGMLLQNPDTPVLLGLLACLGVGLGFGAVNALLITRFKVVPFVVTLSTLIAGRGLALSFTESRAVILPDSVIQIGSARLGWLPVPMVIFASVVLLAYGVLVYTPLGRHIYAIGNDPEAAKKAGLKTTRTLASVYLISGVCAALGGWVSVSQLGIVNPRFGEQAELTAIAAAVLGGASLFGGVGSVFPGTVLGAVLIQMVQSGLVFTRVDVFLQPLFQSGIIFLAVFVDSVRNTLLKRLGRRNIRREGDAPVTRAATPKEAS